MSIFIDAAIILPVYKHSVLVVEAIESCLKQITDYTLRIVIVNDGCPYAETHQTCLEYASTFKDKIIYFRKENGGLSSARNTGIELVLKTWPSFRALYFMDADNRLRETALQASLNALFADNKADWIYPDIEKFGLREYCDSGKVYSVFEHSMYNICEAGSLVSRRIIDAGIRFDENMKLGYEDWDFFLQATQAGFRGKKHSFGLQYRYRPASMLADALHYDEYIKTYIRLKHQNLYNPRTLTALEHDEHPRYAIYLMDKNYFSFATDIDIEKIHGTYENFEAKLYSFYTSEGKSAFPEIIYFTTSDFINAARQGKIIHNLLWWAEKLLSEVNLVSIECKNSSDNQYIFETNKNRCCIPTCSQFIGIKTQTLHSIIIDKYTDWINSIVNEQSNLHIANISYTIDCDVVENSVQNVYNFLALVHKLRASRYRQALDYKWSRKFRCFVQYKSDLKCKCNGLRCSPYPKINTSCRDVGFILPFVEFGGVEKVAWNIAHCMRNSGFTPHLFIVESGSSHIDKEWLSVFESVNFLDGSAQWDATKVFLGTNLPKNDEKVAESLLAMLHWLDVVVNFHSGITNTIVLALKKIGIITVNSLHLDDFTPFSRPYGHVTIGLGYENGWDLFLPCSHWLTTWLHGMGVPSEKIIPVPNAAGYKLDVNDINEVRKIRLAKSPNDPLKILYLGRLDRQKGIHKVGLLMDIFAYADIDWRIVGKSVQDKTSLPQPVSDILEQPVYTSNELTKLYLWADVLILPSEYEGLPLTLFEAQRLGCVPICSNVCAVSEAVQQNCGILVDAIDDIEAFKHAILFMYDNRGRLKEMQTNAIDRSKQHCWQKSTRALF